MNYYHIGCGVWDNYDFRIFSHNDKFTKKEVVSMYEDALNRTQRKDSFGQETFNKFCEIYGFILIEPEFEINTDFDI